MIELPPKKEQNRYLGSFVGLAVGDAVGVLSISEMGHCLNRRLFNNQAALTSSLWAWL